MRSAILIPAVLAGAISATPSRLTQAELDVLPPAQEKIVVPQFASNDEYDKDENSIFHEPLIDHINTVQPYWKAVDPRKGEVNALKDFTYGDLRKLVPFTPSRKSGQNDAQHILEIKDIKYDESQIPEFFDAREKWFDCQTISLIRDQGSCGACWTFGSTSPMSARTCIASKGKYQNMVSALHLGGCCRFCSLDKGMCEGGESQDAYTYWKNDGLVSGDNFASSLGCQPYPINISIVHVPGQHVDSPKCDETCTNSAHKTPFQQDKVFAKDIYRIAPNDVKAIQWEIMTNGPVTFNYHVFDDFPLYKEGVYVQTSEKEIGEHCVMVIGWGEELINGKKVPYWTIANSWNRLWGLHGYFKIIRGQNECNIEHENVAGIPDIDRLNLA